MTLTFNNPIPVPIRRLATRIFSAYAAEFSEYTLRSAPQIELAASQPAHPTFNPPIPPSTIPSNIIRLPTSQVGAVYYAEILNPETGQVRDTVKGHITQVHGDWARIDTARFDPHGQPRTSEKEWFPMLNTKCHRVKVVKRS